jgi:lysozyme
MVTSLSQSRINELNCVLGLDCSKYQKDINWGKAKAAEIRFAFVKITEGTIGHEDNIYNLKGRVLAAQNAGVKIGYYHFAKPGNVNVPEDDANEEVQNILAHLAFLPKVKLPFVLDIEAYSSSNIWDNKIDHMNRFIKTFIQKLNEQNIPVIFYSYKSFIEENMSPLFGLQPLWIAAYLNNPEANLPTIPDGWTEWKIWQFTEKGKIDGYDGDIDLNIMKTGYFDLF